MKKLLAIVLFCIYAASPAAALPPPDSGQALTLDRYLAIARANNLSLQQAQKASHIAELSRKEISKTAYPQVSFLGNGTYAPLSSRHGYDPAISNEGQLGGQVILEQSLYDGGIRGLRIAQADLDIRRLSKEQQLVLKDLELNVT